jgi:hypothetical protein
LDTGELDNGPYHGGPGVHDPGGWRQVVAVEKAARFRLLGFRARIFHQDFSIMDKIINFQILKHPLNWIIVMLMVFIAGIAFHFFLQYQTGTNPADFVKAKAS